MHNSRSLYRGSALPLSHGSIPVPRGAARDGRGNTRGAAPWRAGVTELLVGGGNGVGSGNRSLTMDMISWTSRSCANRWPGLDLPRSARSSACEPPVGVDVIAAKCKYPGAFARLFALHIVWTVSPLLQQLGEKGAGLRLMAAIERVTANPAFHAPISTARRRCK